MSGCINTQIRLVSALWAWESAELAAKMFPNVREQEQKADQLHLELTRICLACGFSPGRDHRHLSVVEFAKHRAATLKRVFPAHFRELLEQGRA